MKIILNWLVSTLAIVIAAYIINGFWADAVTIRSFWAALVAALVLGIVNALIKPVLNLIALPITILTLGLFALVINALMVWLVAAIVPGFSIAGFSVAVIFSLVLSLIGWFLHKIA